MIHAAEVGREHFLPKVGQKPLDAGGGGEITTKTSQEWWIFTPSTPPARETCQKWQTSTIPLQTNPAFADSTLYTVILCRHNHY